MTNSDLEKTLDSLHMSLANAPDVDEQTAAKLRSLIDEIQMVLEKSSPPIVAHPSHPSLATRVQDLISDFEVNHPKLTSNLSLIAERLADMGIQKDAYESVQYEEGFFTRAFPF